MIDVFTASVRVFERVTRSKASNRSSGIFKVVFMEYIIKKNQNLLIFILESIFPSLRPISLFA